jgi:hypothetical protein
MTCRRRYAKEYYEAIAAGTLVPPTAARAKFGGRRRTKVDRRADVDPNDVDASIAVGGLYKLNPVWTP